MKKLLTILAVVVMLGVILVGVGDWLTSNPQNSGQQAASDGDAADPDGCPRVEFISAPGTWESSADDDPANPTANDRSFMLSISRPLSEAYSEQEVKVWTLPYTAQFRNINALTEMSYDDSRTEGIDRLNAELVDTHQQCPNTEFILAGFSQGAVIVGDIVSDIGNGRGVIPADRIKGAALIADGRREPGVGVVPGTQVGGVGAEIALHPLNAVVQPVVPGATMRGSRAGGFGELNDRVMDVCAPDDPICDAPRDVRNALERARAMLEVNGVHAWYAQNEYVVPGTTADKWTVQWAKELIG
ncbi:MULTISPECIES: cutinase family protein [Corynebacterium]|uniref:cutinase family protein n=1 Tax=Corynebacterium TaxID=1716 RepID=UPI00124EFC9E|nr:MULTISPECIES: cutinase family protein [Corynebacterium]